jgi:hypothetical protein
MNAAENNCETLIGIGPAKGDLDVTVTDCCTWACHTYQKKMKRDVEGPVLNASFSKQEIEEIEEKSKTPEQTRKELFNLCFSSNKSLFGTSVPNAVFLSVEQTQDEYEIRLTELQGITTETYRTLLEDKVKILEKDVQADPTKILDLGISIRQDRLLTNESETNQTIHQIYFEGTAKKIEDKEKKRLYEKKGKPNIIKSILEEKIDSQIAKIEGGLWSNYCIPYAAIESGEKGEKNRIKLAEYWAELTEGNREVRVLLDKKYGFDDEEKKQISESIKIKVDALKHMADAVMNLKISDSRIGYAIERDKNISQYAVIESVWSLNDMIEWQKKKENENKKLERTTKIIEYLPKTSTEKEAIEKCFEYGPELINKLLAAYGVEEKRIEYKKYDVKM